MALIKMFAVILLKDFAYAILVYKNCHDWTPMWYSFQYLNCTFCAMALSKRMTLCESTLWPFGGGGGERVGENTMLRFKKKKKLIVY